MLITFENKKMKKMKKIVKIGCVGWRIVSTEFFQMNQTTKMAVATKPTVSHTLTPTIRLQTDNGSITHLMEISSSIALP